VLDVQYTRVQLGFPRAIPQSRRRVFVVGSNRGWKGAAAVLFESGSIKENGSICPTRNAPPEVFLANDARGLESKALSEDYAYTLTKNNSKRSIVLKKPCDASHPTILKQYNDMGFNTRESITAAGLSRKLTPTEIERLFGFPDGYTDIKPNGKDTPDGPRYSACGNSMGINCMRHIGMRIQLVEDILKEQHA
jgi:DNA (cytosine-5)-methyltransferase 1